VREDSPEHAANKASNAVLFIWTVREGSFRGLEACNLVTATVILGLQLCGTLTIRFHGVVVSAFFRMLTYSNWFLISGFLAEIFHVFSASQFLFHIYPSLFYRP
jgi:hypothetical protein